MNSLYIVCALMAVGTANAFIFGGSTDEAWNDLKVTWGINPFGSAYQSLPRTMNDAIAKGWTKDRDCTQGGSGHRFVLKGDRAVMLIFGANGNIAGISAGIPKNLPLNYPGEPIKKFFDDEGDFLSITAYFTDPTTVCSTGPSTKLATGDRLIFKSKTFQVEVAREESKVDSSFWTLGKCFYTMGVHYWADISGAQIGADTEVENFVPIFLQYNKGKLNGFGWAFGYQEDSARVEHPPASALSGFFQTVPNFLKDTSKVSGLSTLHVYLDSSPLTNFC